MGGPISAIEKEWKHFFLGGGCLMVDGLREKYFDKHYFHFDQEHVKMRILTFFQNLKFRFFFHFL